MSEYSVVAKHMMQEEVRAAVREVINELPIRAILESNLLELMDKAVDENYYLLSNRVADTLLSGEIDLREPIENALLKALYGVGRRD